jgi:hypothetical protein
MGGRPDDSDDGAFDIFRERRGTPADVGDVRIEIEAR